MDGVMAEGALSGIRVLDLGNGVAAAYCAKLLADYGADVIKVEPPEGDPLRLAGPFPGDVPDRETGGGLFLHLNTNKRGVTLDLSAPGAADTLLALAQRSDAVVESYAPGYLAGLGLGYEALKRANPAIVLTSITPFGQSGPYSRWLGSEMVLFAMSSRMSAHGHQEREPLRYAPETMGCQAGATAATATLGALWGAQLQGRGEWIDLSIQEALAGNVDCRLLLAEYSRRPADRSYLVRDYPRGAYPCKDGFVLFGSGIDRYFRRVCRAIGRPELLDDPRWATAEARPGQRDAWEAIFLDWLVDRTRAEVVAECQRHKVMCAPILTVDEVYRDPQIVHRRFFRPTLHSSGEWPLPGPPFTLEEGPWEIRRTAPLLGQHNQEIYGGMLEMSDEQMAAIAGRAGV